MKLTQVIADHKSEHDNKKELFWINNKTIIEFGFRTIWRIMEISAGVIRPTASTDNTLLDLHNSS